MNRNRPAELEPYMLQFEVFRLRLLSDQQSEPKHCWFTTVNDKEKHPNLTIKKMEPADIWHFLQKNDSNN